jgi:asparagine synthetase B (glutamine-hydrolysing)
MCGIVGVAGDVKLPHERLGAMRDVLRHRGPDDEGLWWSPDGRVGLGHRRLAIIDLSPAGRQPMTDVLGELRITFNGEIYNYLELPGARSLAIAPRPPTLVIPRPTGPGTRVPARLNGMFALRKQPPRAAVCTRSPAKPLFYRHEGQTLTFGSGKRCWPLDARAGHQAPTATRFSITGRVRSRGTGSARPSSTLDQPAFGPIDLPAAEPEPATDRNCWTSMAALADSVRLRLIADVPVGVMPGGVGGLWWWRRARPRA